MQADITSLSIDLPLSVIAKPARTLAAAIRNPRPVPVSTASGDEERIATSPCGVLAMTDVRYDLPYVDGISFRASHFNSFFRI